jgi:BCCT, betaine/carnitine/choline family transporter
VDDVSALCNVSCGNATAVLTESCCFLTFRTWTVFYLLWVVSCSVAFGVFIACISRGRKLWEVIVHCLISPIAYCLVWFCTWEGIGLRQSRQGLELEVLGDKLYNNSRHFLVDGSEVCYEVPRDQILLGDEVVFTNYLPGVSPVCKLDPERPDLAVFNVLQSFGFSFGNGGWGPILSVLFLVGVAISFIASSDVVTLAVDSIASNGRKNYHWSRRLFWASTTGALTTALLSSGGNDSLVAIQAVSILFALSVAVLLCFLVQSVTLFCEATVDSGIHDYVFPSQPEFDMPVYGGIFNLIEYLVSFGTVNPVRVELGMHRATTAQVVEVAKGLVVPFMSLNQILVKTYPQNTKTNSIVVILYAVCYVGCFASYVASGSYPGLKGATWTLFLVGGCILGTVRSGFRGVHDLRSNTFADYASGLFLWPQVLTQMRLQKAAVKKNEEFVQEPERKKKGIAKDSADSEQKKEEIFDC